MVERLFKEIMAENFPKLGKDLDIQVLKANRLPPKFQSKTVFSKTHYNKTKSKPKREFFKQQGEKFSLIQGNSPHKGITIFFSKNLVSLERKWDDVFKGLKEKKIKKKLLAKNTITSKAVLQKWR